MTQQQSKTSTAILYFSCNYVLYFKKIHRGQMGWVGWDHSLLPIIPVCTKTCCREKQIFDCLGCWGKRNRNVSQQAAPYSSRAVCGRDSALQRGWNRGSWRQLEGSMEEKHLHPFQGCVLISVPQLRVFQRKNGVGGEGRGGEKTSLGEKSARSRLGMLVKGGIKGGKGDLGMKYAMRIHLRAVALEVLFQFQGDALHLLSPRTASTHLLPAACLGWHGLPGAAGLSPVPGHPLWPQRLHGGGDKEAESHRSMEQPVGDRLSGLVCSPTPASGHKIIKSLDNLGWRRPLKSWSPTVPPTLTHVPKCHIHMVFEHIQGWWFYPFPGKSLPILLCAC